MKLLMLSVDPRMLEGGSAVRERTKACGSIVEELNVILYTRPGNTTERIAPNIIVHPTNTNFRPLYFWQAYRLAATVVTRDTLVTSQDGMTNFVAVFLKWRFNLRLQVQVHTDFLSPFFLSGSFKNFLHYLGYRLGLAHADCVRVVSERIKRPLMTTGWWLKTEPSVLPLFVDTERFKNNIVTADLHCLYPQFEKVVLMVSRLSPEKDFETALKAFALVSRAFPKAGLVIVGDGGERRRLKNLTRSLAIESSVVFTGWQPLDHVASYYKTADLFLSTSRYEGYGVSLIEAAASGCPTVTTDVGLIGEVIAREHIIVVPIADPRALAKELENVLPNLAQAKQKALGASADVEARPIRNMDDYLAAYKAGLEDCLG